MLLILPGCRAARDWLQLKAKPTESCSLFVEPGPCPTWDSGRLDISIKCINTSGTRHEAEEGDGGWPEPEARSRPHEQTNKTNRNVLGHTSVIQVQYKVGKASGSSRKHARAPISLDRKARAHACHIISKRLAPRMETVRHSPTAFGRRGCPGQAHRPGGERDASSGVGRSEEKSSKQTGQAALGFSGGGKAVGSPQHLPGQ